MFPIHWPERLCTWLQKMVSRLQFSYMKAHYEPSNLILGRKEVADLLIEDGANVNLRDKTNKTAIQWAEDNGNC